MQHDDGLTRSALEDEFKRFCRRHDLPIPAFNRRIAGREVDAYFEAERVIVELDSWGFHSSRASFERDRAKDVEALIEGIPTVRVTHRRLTNEGGAEAERLRRILDARRETLRREGDES